MRVSSSVIHTKRSQCGLLETRHFWRFDPRDHYKVGDVSPRERRIGVSVDTDYFVLGSLLTCRNGIASRSHPSARTSHPANEVCQCRRQVAVTRAAVDGLIASDAARKCRGSRTASMASTL